MGKRNKKPKAIFEPYTAFPGCRPNLHQEMLSQAAEIGTGVAIILQMIECAMIDKEAEEMPLLNNFHQSALISMAITSLQLMAAEASRVKEKAHI